MKDAIYLKFTSLSIIILLSIVIFSCGESSVSPEKPQNPYISELNKDTLLIGDTLIIYGNHFGEVNALNQVILPNNFSVLSANCLIWNNVKISFIVPQNAVTGYIRVAKDTLLSDTVYINIKSYPNYETVMIQAGSFVMGSTDGSADEMPVREVTITDNFLIGKYEVNQQLYETVMKSNPSPVKNPELPVAGVRFLDAVKFCNALSELSGLDNVYVIIGENVVWNKEANGWRLPTEAEWEYACRAGTTADYYGNNLDDLGWYLENSGGKSHPAGRKLINAFGLYDMHGNLWEWCWDWYAPNYYAKGETINPSGPIDGVRRVRRGGAWDAGGLYARSSNRSISTSSVHSTGFRIVRNP